jgi:diguanylate cyclase (GGDEF)-like protein
VPRGRLRYDCRLVLGDELAKFRASTASRGPSNSGNSPERPGDREKSHAARPDLRDAEERVREARNRDDRAEERDRGAAARDRAADERDRVLVELEESAVEENFSGGWVVKYGRQVRREAAADRAAAAEDRRRAAEDRAQAAADRAEALEMLRESQLDDLTGAYRRSLGERLLEDELVRARRSGHGLVLVAMDVDGLKQVNDSRGHRAGDDLLREVVAAVRGNIRSYEPIVRIGGDEFLFSIAGVDRSGALERTAVIRADLARRPSRGMLSLGLAELQPDDELEDLIQRADSELIEARRASVTTTPR